MGAELALLPGEPLGLQTPEPPPASKGSLYTVLGQWQSTFSPKAAWVCHACRTDCKKRSFLLWICWVTWAEELVIL